MPVTRVNMQTVTTVTTLSSYAEKQKKTKNRTPVELGSGTFTYLLDSVVFGQEYAA